MDESIPEVSAGALGELAAPHTSSGSSQPPCRLGSYLDLCQAQPLILRMGTSNMWRGGNPSRKCRVGERVRGFAWALTRWLVI